MKGFMKAAAIDGFGPPSVLGLHQLPIPEPGPDEILIALTAAGVGVWDAEVRDGSWQPAGKPKFPFVLGTDGAGMVAAKGARVRRFSVGERVWAYSYANPKGGFYAEYVAVKARDAGRVPKHLDLLQAGAAPTTGLTALQGIDDKLRLRQGETLLVYGASGAVGTLAVQFAKARSARVIGTATGRQAMGLVRKLGADEVFDARSAKASEHLGELAAKGIDAALVLASGESLGKCLALVRKGGRIAFPHGVEPEPKHRRGVRVSAYDALAGPREFGRLEHAVTEAHLCVPIAAIYPLAQAAKAHMRLERGHVLGRIVLQIRRPHK
jgi:NADPH:quinone reductase-like Zn-dependent oxidoreductase